MPNRTPAGSGIHDRAATSDAQARPPTGRMPTAAGSAAPGGADERFRPRLFTRPRRHRRRRNQALACRRRSRQVDPRRPAGRGAGADRELRGDRPPVLERVVAEPRRARPLRARARRPAGAARGDTRPAARGGARRSGPDGHPADGGFDALALPWRRQLRRGRQAPGGGLPHHRRGLRAPARRRAADRTRSVTPPRRQLPLHARGQTPTA
jgi:hypothetical protein